MLKISSIKANIQLLMNDPLRFTFSLAVLMAAGIGCASYHAYATNLDDFTIQLLAELHGTILDIFMLGILIVWVNNISERRRTVSLCKQQIDDLRQLRSEYVSFKILSAIKELNRHKIFEIDLSGVSLPKAPMTNIQLTGSDLNGFECRKASLVFANLNNCTMNCAIFDKADIFQGGLCNVSANGTSFTRANMSRAKLCNSKFIAASFRFCYLNGASFAGSNLLSADFLGAHLVNVDFTGCKELRADQLLKAKILHNCLLDASIARDLEELKQHHHAMV